MTCKRVLFAFISILWSLSSTCQVGSIKGQIELDTTIWAPIVYLSLIPDFDELYSMSYEMIIDKSPISKAGQYKFITNYLPDGDHLVRIHIAKKNDPPASLIIGGKDENFVFLVTNKRSSVRVESNQDSGLFKQSIIHGYFPNVQLQQINEIASYYDTVSINGFPIRIDLIRNAISEKLRVFADTCSNSIVALYAIYKSGFENNVLVNQQYYDDFLTKWHNEKSTYFTEFRKRIPKNINRHVKYIVIFSLLSFFVGSSSSILFCKIKKRNDNLIKDLSLQERRIFSLLIDGKTNKEISEILNIGLSTVKTHINSIYSKLKIGSRKEVLNLDIENERNNK